VSVHKLAKIFVYRGRIGRKYYWPGLAVVAYIGSATLDAVRPYFTPAGGGDSATFSRYAVVFIFLLSVLMIARLHDCDMSGWWFILFVPLPIVLFLFSFNFTIHADRMFANYELIRIAGLLGITMALGSIGFFLWSVISLGFKQGDPGENKFGSAPT
jgi:uncharacterized membrane protein YhaH (DUF805 family)